jgi:hypothetical protein
LPQEPQKRKPAGFSKAQLGHRTVASVYGLAASRRRGPPGTKICPRSCPLEHTGASCLQTMLGHMDRQRAAEPVSHREQVRALRPEPAPVRDSSEPPVLKTIGFLQRTAGNAAVTNWLESYRPLSVQTAPPVAADEAHRVAQLEADYRRRSETTGARLQSSSTASTTATSKPVSRC